MCHYLRSQKFINMEEIGHFAPGPLDPPDEIQIHTVAWALANAHVDSFDGDVARSIDNKLYVVSVNCSRQRNFEHRKQIHRTIAANYRLCLVEGPWLGSSKQLRQDGKFLGDRDT